MTTKRYLFKDKVLLKTFEMNNIKQLREEIILKTKEYYQTKFTSKQFISGKTRINYAGRVFDEHEIINAVEASLDFWLTEGRFSEQFAEKISEFLGIDHVLLTN
jgi:CDP-6-deoxy-D-xylo-4-hexulose-3-dehydrase